MDMNKGRKPKISEPIQQGAIAFAAAITTGAAAVALSDDGLKFMGIIMLGIVFGGLAAMSRATDSL